MNILNAMEQTLELARMRGMAYKALGSEGSVGYTHIEDMYRQVLQAEARGEPFSDDDRNRWLGFMQASVIAAGCATLDEINAVNAFNRGTRYPVHQMASQYW